VDPARAAINFRTKSQFDNRGLVFLFLRGSKKWRYVVAVLHGDVVVVDDEHVAVHEVMGRSQCGEHFTGAVDDFVRRTMI